MSIIVFEQRKSVYELISQNQPQAQAEVTLEYGREFFGGTGILGNL